MSDWHFRRDRFKRDPIEMRTSARYKRPLQLAQFFFLAESKHPTFHTISFFLIQTWKKKKPHVLFSLSSSSLLLSCSLLSQPPSKKETHILFTLQVSDPISLCSLHISNEVCNWLWKEWNQSPISWWRFSHSQASLLRGRRVLFPAAPYWISRAPRGHFPRNRWWVLAGCETCSIVVVPPWWRRGQKTPEIEGERARWVCVFRDEVSVFWHCFLVYFRHFSFGMMVK